MENYTVRRQIITGVKLSFFRLGEAGLIDILYFFCCGVLYMANC